MKIVNTMVVLECCGVEHIMRTCLHSCDDDAHVISVYIRYSPLLISYIYYLLYIFTKPYFYF